MKKFFSKKIPFWGCRADRFRIVNAIHNFVNAIWKKMDRHSLREKMVEEAKTENKSIWL